MTKNADPDKYKDSGYSTGFNSRGNFSLDSGFGKNVIIFGTDMSSSMGVDNRKRDILILGKGQTQRLDDTILTTEKE